MRLCRVALAYTLLLLGPSPLIGGETAPRGIGQTIDWKIEEQGRFAVCAHQAPSGDVWIGTEDHGLWRLAAAENGQLTWAHYTERNGLGENHVYAIASDRLNRVWVGHASRGVSVFDGSTWKNYDVPRGPIGERIYDIETDATRDAVWIATNAGVSVYDLTTDSWEHLDLPEANSASPVTALAVDERNGVYLGFEAAGLLYCANPGSKKATWVDIGKKLPSANINALAFSRGLLAVASDRGACVSGDRGSNWVVLRGVDADAKETQASTGQKPKNAAGSRECVLSEDFVSAIAFSPKGEDLLIGHRRTGAELIQLQRLALTPIKVAGPAPFPTDYVCAIVPSNQGGGIFCWYGGGVTGEVAIPATSGSALAVPALPTPARATDQDMQAMVAAAVANGKGQAKAIQAIPVADDWRTRGNWLGRRGLYWMCLCASRAPQDYIWGCGEKPVDYLPFLGTRCSKLDSLRYWVHWLYTDNERSLELAPVYADGRVQRGMTTPGRTHRQSEWDDHGEAYPMAFDGPHAYVSIAIPEGCSFLSLYNTNKDGHDGSNRWRDYRISIRQTPVPSLRGKSGELMTPDAALFNDGQELARARNRMFWTGVWKRFLVTGPAVFTVEMNRNHSFNTILAGIAIDRDDPFPSPYFTEKPAGLNASAPTGPIAEQVIASLERARSGNPRWWALHSRRGYVAALGALLEKNTMNAFTVIGLYRLGLFEQYEAGVKALGFTPPREIEKSMKWDGVTYSSSGMGRSLLLNHLKAKSFNPPASLSTTDKP